MAGFWVVVAFAVLVFDMERTGPTGRDYTNKAVWMVGPPMWAFLPWEKKWKMVFSPTPYPKVPYAAQMEYVPDMGGPVLVSGNWSGDGTWLYNDKDNAWKQLNPFSGKIMAALSERSSCRGWLKSACPDAGQT